MSPKLHRAVASGVLALTILALILNPVLGMYVPYYAAFWKEEETTLTSWQIKLIGASELIKAHTDLLFWLLPLLFFIALMWRLALGLWQWRAAARPQDAARR